MDAIGQDAPLNEGSRLFLPIIKKADTYKQWSLTFHPLLRYNAIIITTGTDLMVEDGGYVLSAWTTACGRG